MWVSYQAMSTFGCFLKFLGCESIQNQPLSAQKLGTQEEKPWTFRKFGRRLFLQCLGIFQTDGINSLGDGFAHIFQSF